MSKIKFYVKPSIATMLDNQDKIPCVDINNSKWFNISKSDYDYLHKLVGRLDALPFNSLTESEKRKYSALLHAAERVARCSIQHLKARM